MTHEKEDLDPDTEIFKAGYEHGLRTGTTEGYRKGHNDAVQFYTNELELSRRMIEALTKAITATMRTSPEMAAYICATCAKTLKPTEDK